MSKLKDYLIEKNKPKILNELFVRYNELSKLPMGDERDKQILRLSIIAELDAANLYENMISLTRNKDLKTILQDIANEEKVHVGEFEYLLEEIDPEHEEFEDEGEEEAEEIAEAINPKTDLILLGKEVNYAMGNVGLRPKREDFKKAAKKLGITIKQAERAWNKYTWD